MSVILVFAGFVIIGDAFAVTISYLLESISTTVSLVVFLTLFIFVFWASWQLAVRIVERYIVRQD